MLELKDILIGKIDGKYEYLDGNTAQSPRSIAFYDAFLIPPNVDATRINNNDMHFVRGFRGTGKTSFLRWHANMKKNENSVVDFVLFKTDLDESQRMHLSREAGITWADVDSKKMEISQDFKASWRWFILHKIGQIVKDHPAIVDNNENSKSFTKLLGLDDKDIFSKFFGVFPKLESGDVKVSGNLGFFEAEMNADFKKHGDAGKVSLSALTNKLIYKLERIKFNKQIYIYFDELEAFYHSPEQMARDQRMVRDLLFSIAFLNDKMRAANVDINLVGAVRSEVLDSMGALGEEVERVVQDKGFHIVWHHAKKSMNHPLLMIIERKINGSEKLKGIQISDRPLTTYFPNDINGEGLETFLLDRSFYKPRDLIWRLSLAQELFPNTSGFTRDSLVETETEYSKQMWNEIKYELSAAYSVDEISVIEQMLAGRSMYFERNDIENAVADMRDISRTAQVMFEKKSVVDILQNLYRLGAIGNAFRTGSTGSAVRNRWAFRGDPTLLVEKRMMIHPSLAKRLSSVAVKRRGTRAGR